MPDSDGQRSNLEISGLLEDLFEHHRRAVLVAESSDDEPCRLTVRHVKALIAHEIQEERRRRRRIKGFELRGFSSLIAAVGIFLGVVYFVSDDAKTDIEAVGDNAKSSIEAAEERFSASFDLVNGNATRATDEVRNIRDSLSSFRNLDLDALGMVTADVAQYITDSADQRFERARDAAVAVDALIVQSLDYLVFSGSRAEFGPHVDRVFSAHAAAEEAFEAVPAPLRRSKDRDDSLGAMLEMQRRIVKALEETADNDYTGAILRLKDVIDDKSFQSQFDSRARLCSSVYCLLATVQMINDGGGTKRVIAAENNFKEALNLAAGHSSAWSGVPWNGLGVNALHEARALIEIDRSKQKDPSNENGLPDVDAAFERLRFSIQCFHVHAEVEPNVQALHRRFVNIPSAYRIMLGWIVDGRVDAGDALSRMGFADMSDLKTTVKRHLDIAKLVGARASSVQWERARFRQRLAGFVDNADVQAVVDGGNPDSLRKQSQKLVVSAIEGGHLRLFVSPEDAIAFLKSQNWIVQLFPSSDQTASGFPEQLTDAVFNAYELN
ncbi:MAG: hypothetical protein AAF108_02590 [Planctomycetota bacterium]